LMTGEFKRFLPSLIDALGGEQVETDALSAAPAATGG